MNGTRNGSESIEIKYQETKINVSLHNLEMATKVQRIGEDLFMVPSSKTGELTYEVNSSVGWCSCPAGRDGAFCKHQTLIHEVFGVGFPNLPPIDCQGKYQLALLALAEKSPPLEFFIGLKETVTEEMVCINNFKKKVSNI